MFSRLELNKEQLGLLLANLPSFAVLVDRQRRYLWVNRADPSLSADEILGKPVEDFVTPADREVAISAIEEAFRSKSVTFYEAWGYGAGQFETWFSVRIVPLGSSLGGAEVALLLATDETARKLAERALAEKQMQLGALVEGTVDGILMVDVETQRFEFSNSAMSRLLGYSPEEFRTKSIRDIHPAEALPRVANAFQSMLESGPSVARGVPVLRKDGGQEIVDISASVVVHGGRRFVIAAFHDIGEHRRVLDALQRSEARYQRAERGTHDGLWEWNCLTREAYFSARWLEIVGYETGELPGTMDAFHELMHPEDRPRIETVMVRHLETGDAFDVEMRLRHKDGNYCWVRARAQAEWDANGIATLMTGSLTDISDRKGVENLLQVERDRLRQILDSHFACVAVLSLDGVIVEINQMPLTLFGVTREQVLGRKFCEVGWLKSGTETTTHQYVQAAAKGAVQRAEITATFPGIGYRQFDAAFAPLRDNKGRISNVVVFGVDVTERKQAESALRVSEARFREAQRIAHLGLLDWDVSKNEVLVSGETIQIFGLTGNPGVLSTDEVLARVHPDDRARLHQSLGKALSGDFKHDLELRVIRQDGKVVYVHSVAEAVSDGPDSSLRLLGTILDLTALKEAEAALRASESRLRTIVDSEPECVKLLDADCTLLDMNPAGLKMIAAESLKQVQGMNVLALLDPQYHELYVDGVAEVFKGNATQQVFEVVCLDGRKRWMEQHAVPLWDVDNPGKVKQLLAVARDISAQKIAEQALRESEARLRQAHVLAGLGTWELNLTTGDLWWSEESYRLCGVDPSSPIKQEIFLKLVHPEDRETFDAAFQRLLSEGTGQTDYRIIRPDGLIRLMRGIASLAPAASSGSLRIVGTNQDITQFRDAELALRESEGRLNEAQRIAHIGNWELDLANNRLFWSDEVFRIFEIDRQEFGASYEAFLNAVHPEDRKNVDEAYSTSLVDRRPYSIAHRLQFSDGRIRHVEEQCETDFGSDGMPLRSRGTVQDITERVLGEQSLRRALQEKDTLLREVHHRVKNNLQVVSSLLYFQGKNLSDPQSLKVFSEIRTRLQSMILVHEHLYKSNNLAQVVFADYIQTLVGQLTKSHAATGAEIRFQLHLEPISLPLEVAIPCGMILVELITNVTKYAFPDGGPGEAVIRLYREAEFVKLTVADSGVGLPGEFDLETCATFGWQLVRALTLQLEGTAAIDRRKGTHVTISFPEGLLDASGSTKG